MNKQTLEYTMAIASALAISAIDITLASPPPPLSVSWQKVVNNGDYIPTANCNPTTPTTTCRQFNSYNQPSVNEKKLVVFRARSKGGQGGEPVHGVYTRDMREGDDIVKILDRETGVPNPNNQSSTFTEPPSFPRIDKLTSMVATRGNHQPVWEYTLLDGTDTKTGTTGIYANPIGSLITGASKLGAVPEYSFYQVPEYPGTAFDVFPGAPAVTQGSTIVFKGNYTVDAVSKTGVYYRNLKRGAEDDSPQPVVLIANNTHTKIPGTDKLFGSTAPPSAVGKKVIFAGFDNEENPTAGGIYLAPLERYPLNKQPNLTTLVRIGSPVPSVEASKFNKLGEGVSFDGRFVAYWGAWGDGTKTVRLYCPKEGNKDLKKYCESGLSGNTQDPNGDWYTEKEVPENQGVFVYDLNTKKNVRVAKTGAASGEFSDFTYWNFSGKAPGVGEGSDDDGELARWRSASFLAVSSNSADREDKYDEYYTAFKARTGDTDEVSHVYNDPKDGIYLRKGRENNPLPLLTLVETGMDGTIFDAEAIDPDTGSILPVTEMGIERDGFRGDSLAVNVSMGTEEAGWAGIYLMHLRSH